MHHFNTKTPQITVCCKTSYDIVFILLSVQNLVKKVGSQENHQNCCQKTSDFKKRRQILSPKCTKLDFGWGSAPDTAELGELKALPRPPSWI